MKYAFLIIALVAFSAGCTGLSGVFGGDVLVIKQNLIQQGQKDIVVIKDEVTIPKSPMLPGSSFIFSFLLENVDKSNNAKNVMVELFNAPTVKNDIENDQKRGQLCNTGEGDFVCRPDKLGKDDPCRTQNRCIMLPGEQMPINFYLKTPEKEEIVNIETKPTLDYRVLYDFESSSLYIMPSVDMDEIIKNQRSNDKVNIEITKSYGTGPVRIDMELFGTKYILSGQPATFIFKLTNDGRGNVVGSQIEKGNFAVSIPVSLFDPEDGKLILPDGQEYEPDGQPTDGRFVCGTRDSYVVCENNDILQMYKDQTRGSLRFQITKTASLDQPFLSYELKSGVRYKYELRGTQEITVKPFEG
jgi:hypothetical protein